ncbi:uncharacterized protein G2W53_004062 [Senna tora]|uniref:Retrotransposon gag domain-containing protein n=1 Tax=Senna tora TaxID=362788 RepID=A0A834XB79_9FABA|nr:uncharacterized protein G2W53_004062 [Senna tora]
MAYVQSPCTARDFYTDNTCFTRPLTSNGLVFTPSPTTTRKRRGHAISHSPVRSPISPCSPESTHSEEAEMVEQNNRNVSDATPKLDGLQHSIRRPSIQANNFEIKPATIQLLQANGQFGGSPIEDPNNHILNFLEICDTFKHNGVSDDAICLRLFPFSLRDKEKVWLQSLPEGSISTWEELAQQFLTKYFPPGKTAKMRNDITSFVLLDNESLYEAWEIFKELLRKCQHHGLPKWLQVQTFYNELSSEIRTSIDAAAGGALMSKQVDAAYTLLETMSSNNHQWHSDRNVHARVARVQDSDMFASLSSQIATLTKEVKSLAYPRGIVENVLVKVDKLILPADFIVLDYEEDKNVPIILDRPFLATGRTIIDVQKGEMTMRVQDQEVKFNMFKAMKLPEETEECFHVNVVDNVVDCSVQDDELKYHPIDPSEIFKYPYAETCDVDFVRCAKILEAPPWKIRAPPWANVVAKQGPNAQRVKLPGFKETQWSIKRRIRMAYLEAQTQHLRACNGAKLIIQKAELMVLRELELSWSQPELIWNLWIEEKLTL